MGNVYVNFPSTACCHLATYPFKWLGRLFIVCEYQDSLRLLVGADLSIAAQSRAPGVADNSDGDLAQGGMYVEVRGGASVNPVHIPEAIMTDNPKCFSRPGT